MADHNDLWVEPMREAIALALSPDAPFGENPRVGCVIVDPQGEMVGRGHHRGAGTPHAEVDALADAGERARGATAVVSLEPCRHTGRTGPCTTALIDAGVARVVFGQDDPTTLAGGGTEVLRSAGVDVVVGVLAEEAEKVNEAWTFAQRNGRPMVTWKVAVSLDGRVAGPDGGPTAITGEDARREVHRLRAEVGAVVIGTGTALVDDPELTVRLVDAVHGQPLRVVVGSTPLPGGARLMDDSAPTLLVDEPDPAALLSLLYARGVRHVLLEGGPTLAGSFVQARLVDRVVWYVAPLLLGGGPIAFPPDRTPDGRPLGVAVDEVTPVGEDVRISGTITYERAEQ
jgi:diaminohydroxyphosphoribosylaminopyrimidine deaminase/5-amino-6-(5-phosphoribosylamino)uracil reductase